MNVVTSQLVLPIFFIVLSRLLVIVGIYVNDFEDLFVSPLDFLDIVGAFWLTWWSTSFTVGMLFLWGSDGWMGQINLFGPSVLSCPRFRSGACHGSMCIFKYLKGWWYISFWIAIRSDINVNFRTKSTRELNFYPFRSQREIFLLYQRDIFGWNITSLTSIQSADFTKKLLPAQVIYIFSWSWRYFSLFKLSLPKLIIFFIPLNLSIIQSNRILVDAVKKSSCISSNNFLVFHQMN